MNTVNTIELRKFGLILSCVFMGAFGFLLPILLNKAIPTWPWIVGTLIFVPTMVKPDWLKVIYHPWMKLGHILGWVNTRIILGVIFFALITPIGLIRRLLGNDPLGLTFDQKATTYRTIIPSQGIKHMENPF
ncbi:MAG: SxtJ family membrane protein [Candidatus Berkiella sp.]